MDFQRAKQRMLRRQLRGRGIRDPRVLAAMASTPREEFVRPDARNAAYSDCALPIDCGQTISQPYMVALMSEALNLSGAEKVLEIGTGSGYQTAILAELARTVVTIERHAELSAGARETLRRLGRENVILVVGDGTQGWPPEAPYDRILVTAAAGHVPEPLFAQLADGGLLVIPLGGRDVQMLQAIRRVGSSRQATNLTACRFVPLVGAEEEDVRSPLPPGEG